MELRQAPHSETGEKLETVRTNEKSCRVGEQLSGGLIKTFIGSMIGGFVGASFGCTLGESVVKLSEIRRDGIVVRAENHAMKRDTPRESSEVSFQIRSSKRSTQHSFYRN